MVKGLEWVVLSAQPLLPFLLDAVLKTTVVLAVAGVLVLTLRRRSAAARHGVWTLAVVGCLGLPVLAAVLPSWIVEVPSPWPAAPTARPAHPLFPAPGSVAELPSEVRAPGMAQTGANDVSSARDDSTNPPPAVASAAAPVAPAALAIPVWAWALVIWLTGTVLAVFPLVAGCASLRRLRGAAHPVMDGTMLALLAELANGLGLRRSVTLLQSPRRSMPMTWGLWRPVILLPLDAGSWPLERLRVVLLHELAHVRRWDCLTQLLAHCARALYWFHPLAWWAVARLRQAQEQACDDAVLSSGVGAADYAEHLLAVTAGLPATRLLSPVALAMSRSRKIEQRLAAILNTGRCHRPLTGRWLGVLTLAGLGLLLPLGSLRLQTAPAAQAAEPAAEDTAAPPPTSATLGAKKLAEVHATVIERYVKAVNEKELTEAAIRGLLAALNDPYSEYLTPDQMAAVERSLSTSFAGVGVQIHMTDGRLEVVSPLEDSPALQAGIRPGDVIEAIDGQTTKGIALEEAVRRVLGPPNSVVKFQIRHADGAAEQITVTRRQIQVHSVKGFRRDARDHWEYLLDPEHGIGYLDITHFTATTVDDLRQLIQRLMAQGLKGLILDLRCCPGGLLEAAVETAKLFLAKGTIVTIKGHEQEKVTEADGQSLAGDLPLVVLVNGQTASAGEIVAGALKDNERAVVLGSRTYGKGSVQELIQLEGGGTIRLTTAYYYLPSRRAIHRTEGSETWGVDPTDGYYLPLDGQQTEAIVKKACERYVVGKKRPDRKAGPLTPKRIEEEYADPQLAAALKAMTARVTTGTFEKVGKGMEALATDLTNIRRKEIQKRREALMKNLEQVDKELSDLEKSRSGAKP